MFVLIYGARNAVLRAREYYADAWAGSSDATRSILGGILERMPPKRSVALSSLWGVHPGPGSRVRCLRDTTQLFRPRLGDVVAAGVLAGFAYPTVREFLFLLLPVEHTLSIAPGAALVSASLTGVVLGTVVWRASLAARARDRALPRATPIALAATWASAWAKGSPSATTAR